MITLSVTSYNNEPPSPPLSAVFDHVGGTIGRSVDCHLVLADPRRHVSRLQAFVFSDGDRHTITNLSQANGLLINGQELNANQEHALCVGDEIIAGLFVLHAENGRPSASVIHPQSSTVMQVDPIPPRPTYGSPLQPVVELAMPLWPDIAAASSRNATPLGENPFADLMRDLDISAVPITDQFVDNALIANAPPRSVDTTFIPDMPPRATVSKSDVDVQDPPRIAEPAIVRVDFDDLLVGSTHGSPLSRQSGGTIPNDFNPFDLPSHAIRNSADPLEVLAEHDVSLASFEHRIAGSLISAATDAPIAPLLTNLAQSGTVDPILLFSPESILPPGESQVARERAVANHVQELHAPFRMPVSFFQTAGDDDRQHQDFAPAPVTYAGAVASVLPAKPCADALSTSIRQAAFPVALPIEQSDSLPEAAASSILTQSPPIASTSTPSIESTDVKPKMAESPTPPISGTRLSADERQALLNAFIEGAAIAPDAMTAPLTPDLMRSIGQMLAAATQGTVELISSRALVKREVKADVTMIVVKNNNPLKFLPDGQTALTQMFGRKVPGFMEPVEAMNDAYEDLRAHQIGVVAGMRAALDDVLRRFNPDHLDKRLKQPGIIDSLLPAKRKARKWDLHHDLFQTIHAESQDDFQALFGKAFLNAYENEIERFKRENAR